MTRPLGPSVPATRSSAMSQSGRSVCTSVSETCVGSAAMGVRASKLIIRRLCLTNPDTMWQDSRRVPTTREDARQVRAGRLLNLLLTLQNGSRMTAAELARRLEVSERTLLRDIDVLSGAGVPVFAVRGCNGGFELLDTFEQDVPPLPPGLTPGRGRLRRVRVCIAPRALHRALVLGRPTGWRPRATADPHPDRPEWLEGSFRFDSYESAVAELLALGVDVEVLLPDELRQAMAQTGRAIATLHQPNLAARWVTEP